MIRFGFSIAINFKRATNRRFNCPSVITVPDTKESQTGVETAITREGYHYQVTYDSDEHFQTTRVNIVFLPVKASQAT